MADCVCDLYGGCCDDARQREYARAWPPPEESAALLDPSIVPWLERLNAIPGIETLQSCSGDHPGAETPAHVWIAGRLPHSLCREIGRLDGVEDLSILYEREAFPVTEVRFNDWLTGFRNLTEYLEAATTPAQREHARTFGPSVSTASANGVDYWPLLGRVGADGPDPEAADA